MAACYWSRRWNKGKKYVIIKNVGTRGGSRKAHTPSDCAPRCHRDQLGRTRRSAYNLCTDQAGFNACVRRTHTAERQREKKNQT